MNNYLLFGHLLQCKISFNDADCVGKTVATEKLHTELFKGANEKFVPLNYRKRARKEHNKERTEEQEQKRVARLVKKRLVKMDKIKEMGLVL